MRRKTEDIKILTLENIEGKIIEKTHKVGNTLEHRIRFQRRRTQGIWVSTPERKEDEIKTRIF